MLWIVRHEGNISAVPWSLINKGMIYQRLKVDRTWSQRGSARPLLPQICPYYFQRSWCSLLCSSCTCLSLFALFPGGPGGQDPRQCWLLEMVPWDEWSCLVLDVQVFQQIRSHRCRYQVHVPSFSRHLLFKYKCWKSLESGVTAAKWLTHSCLVSLSVQDSSIDSASNSW